MQCVSSKLALGRMQGPMIHDPLHRDYGPTTLTPRSKVPQTGFGPRVRRENINTGLYPSYRDDKDQHFYGVPLSGHHGVGRLTSLAG